MNTATVITINSVVKTDSVLNGVVIIPLNTNKKMRLNLRAKTIMEVRSYNAMLYEYDAVTPMSAESVMRIGDDVVYVYKIADNTTKQITTQNHTLYEDGCSRIEILNAVDVKVIGINESGNTPNQSPIVFCDLNQLVDIYDKNSIDIGIQAVKTPPFDIRNLSKIPNLQNIYFSVSEGLVGNVEELGVLIHLQTMAFYYTLGVYGELSRLFDSMKNNGRVNSTMVVSLNPNFTVNGVVMQKSGNVIFDNEGNWDASDLFNPSDVA